MSDFTTIRCSECGHTPDLPSLAELALFTIQAFGWKRLSAPAYSDELSGVCDDCIYQAAAREASA